jgi:8-oxo-dGTP pyrophosphatase MutT (NUDIX family)
MATPEFILRLREKIGHDPLWLPGTTAVVLDDEGRVLLGKRADDGRWTLITGCLDPGEEPAVGAVREVLEETGVVAVADRLLSVETVPMHTYANGDQVEFVDMTFRCRATGGQARVNDDESTEVGWFATDDLPPLPDRHAAAIRRALLDSKETWFVTG